MTEFKNTLEPTEIDPEDFAAVHPTGGFGLGTPEPTLDPPDDPEEHALEPTCDTSEVEFGFRFIDYHDRGPRDVVVSGPLTGGWGPGRWFQNRRQAFAWATEKYGTERVKSTQQSQWRWSFLVKNLRAE